VFDVVKGVQLKLKAMTARGSFMDALELLVLKGGKMGGSRKERGERERGVERERERSMRWKVRACAYVRVRER